MSSSSTLHDEALVKALSAGACARKIEPAFASEDATRTFEKRTNTFLRAFDPDVSAVVFRVYSGCYLLLIQSAGRDLISDVDISRTASAFDALFAEPSIYQGQRVGQLPLTKSALKARVAVIDSLVTGSAPETERVHTVIGPGFVCSGQRAPVVTRTEPSSMGEMRLFGLVCFDDKKLEVTLRDGSQRRRVSIRLGDTRPQQVHQALAQLLSITMITLELDQDSETSNFTVNAAHLINQIACKLPP